MSATILHQHNHTNMPSDVSKGFYASKIHQSYIIKLIIHKEYYFIFNLNKGYNNNLYFQCIEKSNKVIVA
jgi:hypothetical protein